MSKVEPGSINHLPPTIITLTLPTPEAGGIPPDNSTATLLIQRGELAHLRQFHFHGLLDDLFTAIHEASEALGLLEDNPPVIQELPAITPKSEPKIKPPETDEKTISIALRKGTKTVQAAHLHPAENPQALWIAGKLIDGGLWDGDTPISIDDVYNVQRRLRQLTDKELSLFALEDFARMVTAEPPSTPQVGDIIHLIDEAVDEDGELIPFTEGRVVEVDPSGRVWLENLDGEADVWVNLDQLS